MGFPRTLNALLALMKLFLKIKKGCYLLCLNIRDKVVIITGASLEVGEATAKELASKGAKLVFAARREDRLKKLQDEIQTSGETSYL